MEAGRTFKVSVAASAILHAIALCALLFLAGSSISGSKRQVFFVELKEARLVAPAAAVKDESKSAVQRKAEPVKKKGVRDKAKPAPSETAPVVEEKPAPEPEAAPQNEAPSMAEAVEADAVSENGADFSTETVAAEAPDPGRLPDEGFEDFALSSGPVESRSEMLEKIRQAIEEELTYPPLARRRKIEGTVVAGFSIDGRGAPRDIEIVESSGFSILDNEVVEIIRRAAPYPHIPERVEVPVSFRLVNP